MDLNLIQNTGGEYVQVKMTIEEKKSLPFTGICFSLTISLITLCRALLEYFTVKKDLES